MDQWGVILILSVCVVLMLSMVVTGVATYLLYQKVEEGRLKSKLEKKELNQESDEVKDVL